MECVQSSSCSTSVTGNLENASSRCRRGASFLGTKIWRSNKVRSLGIAVVIRYLGPLQNPGINSYANIHPLDSHDEADAYDRCISHQPCLRHFIKYPESILRKDTYILPIEILVSQQQRQHRR